MTKAAPAPRLFLLLARDADFAVIVRRGPTHWAHLIKWGMRNDMRVSHLSVLEQHIISR